MKMPTFLFAISAALTLCGVPPSPSLRLSPIAPGKVSPPPPGTQTISGEDIKKERSPEHCDDALRSLSPIFH